ncbi:hypothetical protein POPTR_013G146600v4 [Populus trichocarpa]|uniref:Uncharacterized protein n=1 Tax=Populus trichocarpa TaxID=3694 RepID=A0ACC0S3V4_POPTR|nr:hypothetical protein POPTR_013G146600v4 [Populus trichocarpa]
MANPVAAEDGPRREYPWLDGIKQDIADLSPVSNWSIWKVPNSLRTVNDDAYNPHIISIGPLHRREEKLQSMEVHKLYYMRSLLLRTPDVDETLRSSAEAIEDFGKMVRACYAEPIHTRRDLALLENQIPFFVLERLYSQVVESSTIGQSLPSLPELALGFFKSVLYINDENLRIIRRPYPHVLDLIHKCCSPQPSSGSSNIGEWVSTQPATSLNEAGIVFRKGTTRTLFDLTFRNGALEIPPLLIHDSTVSLFQNLIAYEQLSRCTEKYFTSYFALMSRLVYDRRDAELLESKGIIQNDTSGWKDISVLFNDMRKQVAVQDFYYANLCQNLNSNFRTRPAFYKATLRKTYFRSPWTTASVMAACVLLSLAVIQTVYTVLSYYPQN